ncbi:MAG: hypothetical protein Ct9H300mP15_21860 [Gemmatimonadota bacterium]|nr:MAG: hypothetical protein Ct9H300mP15_21860 [Gemmatimonadota bacterium]
MMCGFTEDGCEILSGGLPTSASEMRNWWGYPNDRVAPDRQALLLEKLLSLDRGLLWNFVPSL